MIYNHRNAPGATVVDMADLSKMTMVRLVDTEAGEVECAYQPVRVNHRGEVDTFKVKFSAIHPISGGARFPCLFHCYGRQA
jgi:hypothetical protein